MDIHGTANRAPVVGEGATICYARDRHAATIIAYDDVKKIITVRQDKATRIDNNGMSDMQGYTYEPNEKGSEYMFKLKSGKWVEMLKNEQSGRLNQVKGGCGIIIGIRDEFYDFTF